MLYNKYILTLIIAIIFSPITSHAQKWNKTIKDIGKEVTKEVAKEIKPLSVDFKVSDVAYNPLKSINKLILTIDFDCENPNSLGVTFNRTEFDLLVNEVLVSKFYNDKNIRVPKNDKFSFQEKAEISLLESGKTIFNHMIKKEALYTITGKYFIDSPIGTFNFKVNLMQKEVNKPQEPSPSPTSKTSD